MSKRDDAINADHGAGACVVTEYTAGIRGGKGKMRGAQAQHWRDGAAEASPRPTFTGSASGKRFSGALAEQRQVRRDFALPVFKTGAKALPQQTIFGANTDFDADQEECDRDRPPRKPPQQKNAHDHHREHGRIDGMADDLVWARRNKLMIGVERGFHSPLLSEVANAGGCEPDPQEAESDCHHKPPCRNGVGPGGPGRKENGQVSEELKKHSPSGDGRALYRRTLLSRPEQEKLQDPETH